MLFVSCLCVALLECSACNMSFHAHVSAVTLAKGIGNGFPLAAVVTTPGRTIGGSHEYTYMHVQ